MGTDLSKNFSMDPSHIWLNAASEGPIPNIAKQALLEAVEWKSSPHLLSIAKFAQVPVELKRSLACLINARPEDIILGNSATYGLHLLANGLPLRSGDEVIVQRNDFPTDILPWLAQAQRGVRVRQIKPATGHVLTLEDVERSLTASVKVVCLPLVHTFSGWPLNIAAIGQMCQKRGILCIVNVSQALGYIPLDITRLHVNACVCAGYKWLLGPYGTGFCWMEESLRQRLEYAQAYWISLMKENDLTHEDDLVLPQDTSSRRYDVFATANFFNFVPWQASIDLLLKIGIDQVNAHVMTLMDQIHTHINTERFDLISPTQPEQRTGLCVISLKNREGNLALSKHLLANGIHTAFWKGRIRISPHIYNTKQQVERFIKTINEYDEK